MAVIMRYTIFVIVAYVIFMIVTIPANRIYPLIQEKLPFTVILRGIDGSMWAGAASDAAIGNVRFRQLKWSWFPWSLLLARVEYDMQLASPDGHASGRLGYSVAGHLLLKNIDLDLPVSILQPFMDLGPIRLAGQLVAKMAVVEIVDGRISNAEGELVWRDAAVNSPQTIALGSFRMVVTAVDEGIQAKVTDTEESALQANGFFLLRPDGRYRFTGTLAPRDSRDHDLAQALRLLGQQGADGKFNISFTGSMPVL